MWNSNSTSLDRRLRYIPGVGTDAATVLSAGLVLPEGERARIAAELFASLESRDPEYSAELSSAWARTVQQRTNGSPAISRRESISPLRDSASTLRSLTREASYS